MSARATTRATWSLHGPARAGYDPNNPLRTEGRTTGGLMRSDAPRRHLVALRTQHLVDRNLHSLQAAGLSAAPGVRALKGCKPWQVSEPSVTRLPKDVQGDAGQRTSSNPWLERLWPQTIFATAVSPASTRTKTLALPLPHVLHPHVDGELQRFFSRRRYWIAVLLSGATREPGSLFPIHHDSYRTGSLFVGPPSPRVGRP